LGKTRKFLAACALVAISFDVAAALVDNGSFTTDSESTLDWLDLTVTNNLSMEDALAANSGWRYATNSEVEGLFAKLFDGFYSTNSYGASISYDGSYADQLTDVSQMHALFGRMEHAIYPGLYLSLGYYIDENDMARVMGSVFGPDGDYTEVYGDDFTQFSYNTTDAGPYFGTYLVRSSVVPVPAAIWFFSSGLGLLAWFRRRQTA